MTLSHGATSVVLMDRPGSLNPFFTQYGCNSFYPNVAVYLDDAATDSVDDTCPLVSNMKPTGFLSAFNGQSRSGTWTLTVSDLSELDAGQLTGVQLYLSP